MQLRVAAKNAPILLRRAFPLNATGNKTGTGALSVTATFSETLQGTLNPAIQNRVPAILRPIMPRGPQLLFNPGGRVSTGPQSGTGTLSVTSTLTTSAARSFNDIGEEDTLSAGVTLSGSVPTAPGVNWTGTGTLSSTHTLTVTAKIGRIGTATLSVQPVFSASGSIVAPASTSGDGALTSTHTLSSTPAINRSGTGALSVTASMTSTALSVRAVASTLSVTASITADATTSAKWSTKDRTTGTWTTIARN